MSKITTHVLDTILGKPAPGIDVHLEVKQGAAWSMTGSSVTDGDGRCRDLIENAGAGVYRLTFATEAYYQRTGRETIYPEVSVTFTCNGEAHFHLPLLLSGNSYTTYRGS